MMPLLSGLFLHSVNPNNAATVFCRGVIEGDTSDWSMLFDQYQQRMSSQIREERRTYLYSMACTNNSAILDKFELDIDSFQLSGRTSSIIGLITGLPDDLYLKTVA